MGEEHVDLLQEHGVDGEEVHRRDPRCLGAGTSSRTARTAAAPGRHRRRAGSATRLPPIPCTRGRPAHRGFCGAPTRRSARPTVGSTGGPRTWSRGARDACAGRSTSWPPVPDANATRWPGSRRTRPAGGGEAPATTPLTAPGPEVPDVDDQLDGEGPRCDAAAPAICIRVGVCGGGCLDASGLCLPVGYAASQEASAASSATAPLGAGRPGSRRAVWPSPRPTRCAHATKGTAAGPDARYTATEPAPPRTGQRNPTPAPSRSSSRSLRTPLTSPASNVVADAVVTERVRRLARRPGQRAPGASTAVAQASAVAAQASAVVARVRSRPLDRGRESEGRPLRVRALDSWPGGRLPGRREPGGCPARGFRRRRARSSRRG
jgi:hypothetical protein